MGKKLYVGNLSYGVDNAALEALFAPFGAVRSAQVIQDRDNRRSKVSASSKWITTTPLKRPSTACTTPSTAVRPLTVNEAKPRESSGVAAASAAAAVGTVINRALHGAGFAKKPAPLLYGSPSRRARAVHAHFSMEVSP